MEIPEEQIRELMRLWPGGQLPHARAKKKLQYLAEHGCSLCTTKRCPRYPDHCVVMDLAPDS